MAIKIVLSPEDESRLTREAVAHGVPPEKYAGDLVLAALAHRVSEKDPEENDDVLDKVPNSTTVTRMRVEQFHTMLHTLARSADRLPNLTTESFTRRELLPGSK